MTRICGACNEPTDRPVGAIGQGRRQLYGRLCACDRVKVEDARGDVDIAGVEPMAKIVGVSRKQFARIRDSDPTKKFHTYPKSNTSFVTSLQAWGHLYGEALVKGLERRKQNLRQFMFDGVPVDVPVAALIQPKTTPRQPTTKKKTPQ